MFGSAANRLLAGSALALILALTSGVNAQTTEKPAAAIDAQAPAQKSAAQQEPVQSSADAASPAKTDNGEANKTDSAPNDTTATQTATPPDVTPAPAVAADPTPAQPATPAVNTAASDQPVAAPLTEKLHELITSKIDRYVDHKKDRGGIETFYAARAYAPLWIENGALNARGNAVIARLKQADTDGLDPADYPVPDFAAATNPEALAAAELKLTATVLTYARFAQTGRVHFSRVSADIFYNQVFPEPADVLAKMADAKDASEVLGSYNPPHAAYKALRAKLAELRDSKANFSTSPEPARIAGGPILKIGMQDARVPALRERLGVSSEANNNTYDKEIAAAVKTFQRAHDLGASGNLTAATVEALNGPHRDRDRDADIIIANMERWRWVPRDLGKAHVIVNLADYTLKVFNDGAMVWSTKIVDGKPSTPTPLLSETIKYITVNPTWNVPPSIINNEYLPALRADPNALERIGLRVEQNRDGTLHIFQPPGEGNALGRIRFNFPNKFLVYQHDTPDKYLFDRSPRAYSHGCMRVQNPDKYAEVLLSLSQPQEGYTVERIHRMYGTGEHDIQLANHIPVHLTYQTAFVDDAGKLIIRPDVYGRDARLLAVLKGDEHRIADIAVEHHEAPSARPQPFQLSQRQGAPNNNPFAFFERLFR